MKSVEEIARELGRDAEKAAESIAGDDRAVLVIVRHESGVNTMAVLGEDGAVTAESLLRTALEAVNQTEKEKEADAN